MRRLLLAVAGALLLAGLAACGEDPGDGIATVSGEATDQAGENGGVDLTDHERGLAFAECMRDNGVDMPDPDPDGGGRIILRRGEFDPETMEPALEACRDLMPEGRRPGDLDPETLEQLREFAECMRDNGVDMPDPDPNGGPVRIGGGEGGVDPDSPEFQAAMEACQDLLAGLRGGR